jgi:hypothetical protein
MPVDPTELEQALKQFRTDVIEAFVSLEIEIDALRNVALEAGDIPEIHLKHLREQSQQHAHRFREKYAQLIGPAHELR